MHIAKADDHAWRRRAAVLRRNALRKPNILRKKMDCRNKPGNDKKFTLTNGVLASSSEIKSAACARPKQRVCAVTAVPLIAPGVPPPSDHIAA